MKLVIFTPASSGSAIARVAFLITQALVSQGHEIVIVRIETGELLADPTYPFGVDIVSWKDTRVQIFVDSFDGVIYHIGDNYLYHGGALEWLKKAPGIICLHDYFVGSLFRGWAVENQKEATLLLERYCSDDIKKSYFELNGEDLINKTANRAPMTEWIASQAIGVVTHSSWNIQRVLDACPGPVQVFPLPYNAPDLLCPKEIYGHSNLTILTIGHMNKNKRMESVIRAIANSPILKDKVTYQLVGRIAPDVSEEMALLAKELGVSLKIAEQVSNEELIRRIVSADILCCLRMPALEAASASTIEAMLYGKPVIVINTGFYQELPDNLVFKVSPEKELIDLQASLEQLCLMEKSGREAIGNNAKEWALKTFCADNYALKLVQMMKNCLRSKPVLDVVNDFSYFLHSKEAGQLMNGLFRDTLFEI